MKKNISWIKDIILYTLYNAILRTPRNFLETRENLKILTHPFYHINLSWFSWEWSKKKIFFFEKKIQNGRLKKSSFFKIANSRNFFAKISEIGPWVSRIEWCEGHRCSSMYMAVRLSDKSSKTANVFILSKSMRSFYSKTTLNVTRGPQTQILRIIKAYYLIKEAQCPRTVFPIIL